MLVRCLLFIISIHEQLLDEVLWQTHLFSHHSCRGSLAGKEAVCGVECLVLVCPTLQLLQCCPGALCSAVELGWPDGGSPRAANMIQVGAASPALQGHVRYLLDRVNFPPRSECSCVETSFHKICMNCSRMCL